jgi:hypothetical protein
LKIIPLSGEIFWIKSPLSSGTDVLTCLDSVLLLVGDWHPEINRMKTDAKARVICFIAVGSVSGHKYSKEVF